MSYTIKHSLGTSERHDSYEDAVAAVRSVYTHAVIGHSGDLSDGGSSTLCWASEELATDDDGSRACCTIRVAS